jgi:hypothetical protein
MNGLGMQNLRLPVSRKWSATTRLGHRSATTTAIYLHTLQELEMRTRLELVPEGAWEPAGEEGWLERSAVAA